MAHTVCPECGENNSKINTECKKCSAQLYKKTPYPVAVRATIILDALFIAVYAAAIALFFPMVEKAAQMPNDAFRASLPEPGSFPFYLVLIFFAAAILIRVAFLVNHFLLKNATLVFFRKALMYLESLSIFQLILALYFYNRGLEYEDQQYSKASEKA